MIGRAFNIQRFSLHDGPGIRTTAFLMGCNLRCRWCHNPEGLGREILLQYDAKSCIGCGACAAVCPKGVHGMEAGHEVRFDLCVGCGACVTECPTTALSFSGKEYTPEELSRLLSRDIPFFKSEGGVTFSGGEPLLQAEFVAETARLCRAAGVPSIAVDTAGLVSREAFRTVLPYVDHFLFDIKAFHEDVHMAGTGVSNGRILENLRWLDAQGKNLYIRVPVIPGINDAPQELAAIGALVRTLHSVREFRLIPYHTFGREKYQTLGLEKPACFPVPTEEKMEELRRITGSC